MEDLSLDDVIRRRGFNNKANNRPQMRGGAVGGVRSRMGPALQTTLGGGGRGMPPLIHRGVGGFDARQKIGVSDARLRLGGGAAAAGGAGSLLPMKDAREKLGQKDARFRIRGQIQDARQTINSRKQGGGASEHQGGGASKLLDARDRLSLKRSIPMNPPSTLGSASSQATPPVKITKTIQVRAGNQTPIPQQCDPVQVLLLPA
ncbi:polymerase delta-interacting protein 3-like isoform X1 [Acipenser ruthenus]|uniref:polymerase delta-interacting protein 3-like isoform X1 n=2 Tax=Acipenser ruthenus TaxID=7906 RepID=UPI0027403E36|nr:polymerase delta-interacting protein 3-like isoform X1 [Acipenser ruthenus]